MVLSVRTMLITFSLVVLAACGESSNANAGSPIPDAPAPAGPDIGPACETLRRYAFVGMPIQYIEEGIALLDILASEFEAAGRADIGVVLSQRIANDMQRGPAGQLSAKNGLVSLANDNCPG